MKLDFITSTLDEKATGLVSGDYMVSKLLNKNIGSITLAENDSFISLRFSDGSKVKFRIKPNGAEVVYYLAPPK